eukprot:552278-Hanusia_phi.AAC.1
MALSCFRQVVVLEKDDRDSARTLLIKAAKQVEPIMVKRKWRVGTLREFLPQNRSLLGLNVNRGETISIRLRASSSSFLEYSHILGTLLHELAHISVGPHNERFYALLEELEQEAASLIAKGIVGVGPFECEGRRSGGQQADACMRDATLAAVLKRKRNQELMGSGRLGGAEKSGFSVRELAGRAAARRARDECTCQTREEGEGEDARARERGKVRGRTRDEGSKGEVIDLTGED